MAAGQTLEISFLAQPLKKNIFSCLLLTLLPGKYPSLNLKIEENSKSCCNVSCWNYMRKYDTYFLDSNPDLQNHFSIKSSEPLEIFVLFADFETARLFLLLTHLHFVRREFKIKMDGFFPNLQKCKATLRPYPSNNYYHLSNNLYV